MNIDDDLPVRPAEADPLRGPTHPVTQFDVGGITETIERALASAGLNTQSGPIKGVTDTIHQALTSAGLNQRATTPGRRGVTIDGDVEAIGAPLANVDCGLVETVAPSETPLPGKFLARSFTNPAGTRAYKLYIPASYSGRAGEPVPMIVMLHGCTQTPDDFAVGTRMNALADRRGFLVVYPAQAANANGSRCWNWFRSEDQHRDSGEPSLIAGITREVASSFRVDGRRIFVAGMSAGAAMAVILGITYPELYSAVGAHSGLPYGSAHDVASAFEAMQGANSKGAFGQPASRPRAAGAVATIVFHGDADRTVSARNGAAIVDQAITAHSEQSRLHGSVHAVTTSGGRTYSRTDYVDAANQPVVEQWVLHGAGHAWSGGSATGSFTDASGPDASAEMLRFFYAQHRAATA